jgi:hypothetical protein
MAAAALGEGGVVILLPRAVRVYFAIVPVNLRMSFDGLSNDIRHALEHNPLSGHVFVFLNRLLLVALLMVEKYVEGVPVHRQRKRLQRLGLDLSVSTLAGQGKMVHELASAAVARRARRGNRRAWDAPRRHGPAGAR